MESLSFAYASLLDETASINSRNVTLTATVRPETSFLRKMLRDIDIMRGNYLRYISPGRRILENTILPFLASTPNFNQIVFVGTDWYTAWYHLLFKYKYFWTIEPKLKNYKWLSP